MIEYLNDDCLSEIFRYLSIKEQLIVTAVNERFCSIIIERFWRIKFNKFTTKGDASCDELNLTEFQIFYRLIAPHIKELTVHSTANVAFTSYLGRYTKRPDLAFYFHFEYPELRVLRCYDQQFHAGYLTSLIRKCPQLEVLKLISSYVTGEHLADFQQLRELYVTSNKLEPKYFHAIFHHKKLTRIQLTGECTVKRDMDAVLKSILPRISELRYYDEEEHLTTQQFFAESTPLFRNLEKLYCQRLLSFVYSLQTLRELHFECHVQLDDLFALVHNNIHLEQLYLGLNFSALSKSREWVCELSDLVRKQEQQRKRELTIHLERAQKAIQQLQQVVEDHDLQHGYLKPAIKIRKLPIDTSQFPILISKSGIEIALKRNFN
ncbi:PREDICTED: uncharacterized protein LOC108380829 [Rhagoletis zephyria]|uniref:uncharacterized protein LOC108380829 n=1 Tax=Rhagoletis zephyria TaxID=28612 RepID=UPI000811A533|nr:PREDICTED: uncharacterized protein LOC108380829 [Rhagoletis zephyria]XP_036317542.1 uncharacterized protein LOC118732519 [Rhagoletis pomonella]